MHHHEALAPGWTKILDLNSIIVHPIMPVAAVVEWHILGQSFPTRLTKKSSYADEQNGAMLSNNLHLDGAGGGVGLRRHPMMQKWG